jgi:hypothetical protein
MGDVWRLWDAPRHTKSIAVQQDRAWSFTARDRGERTNRRVRLCRSRISVTLREHIHMLFPPMSGSPGS